MSMSLVCKSAYCSIMMAEIRRNYEQRIMLMYLLLQTVFCQWPEKKTMFGDLSWIFTNYCFICALNA